MVRGETLMGDFLNGNRFKRTNREIDAHIQILQSGQLRDSLIQRFNLAKEYGIDLSNFGGRSQLHNILATRIGIQKTRFGSVSIQVKDPDAGRDPEGIQGISRHKTLWLQHSEGEGCLKQPAPIQ